jgi:hypothetical protein
MSLHGTIFYAAGTVILKTLVKQAAFKNFHQFGLIIFVVNNGGVVKSLIIRIGEAARRPSMSQRQCCLFRRFCFFR